MRLHEIYGFENIVMIANIKFDSNIRSLGKMLLVETLKFCKKPDFG